MINVFETYRNHGLNFSNDDSIVKITASETVKKTGFCKLNTITETSKYAIIDGKSTTAWANEDAESNTNSYVIFEFPIKPIFVHTFYYEAACHPPKIFHLEGSQNERDWENIRTITTPFEKNKMNSFRCYIRKHYRYIKMFQEVNTLDGYRMHIINVEIQE